MNRVLPEALRERVMSYPEWRMGAHRVGVFLRDGRQVDGVHVAWVGEIVKVDGFDEIPFDADDVVDIYDQSERD